MSEGHYAAGRKLSPIELLRTIRLKDPAVGAEWSQTVPGGELWLPLAIRGQLVSSASAGSRATLLKVTDGTQTVYEVPSGISQGASREARFSWMHDLGSAQFFNAVVSGPPVQIRASVSLPTIWLPPGFTIGAETGNFLANDAWSAITLLVAWRLVAPSARPHVRRSR